MSVTPEDIAVALGRPTPTESDYGQWDMWISDAELLIRARLGDLADLDEAKLNYVVREAVLAHIRNPDNATQVEVAVDDGRYSRTYATSKGRVAILDEWWDLLAPTKASGAFVIDTVSCASAHLAWCSLAFGALYCSCGVDIAGSPIFEVGGS